MADAEAEVREVAIGNHWTLFGMDDGGRDIVQWWLRNDLLMTVRYRWMGNLRIGGLGVLSATVMRAGDATGTFVKTFKGAAKRDQITAYLRSSA